MGVHWLTLLVVDTVCVCIGSGHGSWGNAWLHVQDNEEPGEAVRDRSRSAELSRLVLALLFSSFPFTLVALTPKI